MDGSHCPEGLYTDRAFQRPPLDECSTPVWLFWASTIGLSVLRFVCFFKKIDNFIKYNATSSMPRKPTSLLTHLFASLMYFLVAILVGTNIANVDNGISFSIYSMAYLSFVINYSVLLTRTVRLGRRLIPKETNEQMQFGDLNFLSRFSALGLLLIFFQSACAAVSCVVLIIVSPIIPWADGLLGRIGFMTKGVFQMLCILGIVVQFQRCIHALSSFRAAITPVTTLTDTRGSQLARTILIMRQRQVTITLLGFGVSFLFILLGAEVIPWTWPWIILGTAGPETFGSFVLEFFFNGNKKRNSSQGPVSRQQSNNRAPQAGDSASMQVHAVGNRQLNNYNEEDELHDLPSSEGQSFQDSQAPSRTKRGPIGKRFRRRPKPAIDLTKVTEEQTYVSSNPIASPTIGHQSRVDI